MFLSFISDADFDKFCEHVVRTVHKTTHTLEWPSTFQGFWKGGKGKTATGPSSLSID